MFNLDEEQEKKISAWMDSHDKTLPCGAIGGIYTYRFTPNSLGMVVTVMHNLTGDIIDVTNFDEW